MQLFTSYYAKCNKINDCAYIRVSNSKPMWFTDNCLGLAEVYPDWALIRGLKEQFITEEQYTQAYLKQLSYLNPQEILAKIESYAKMQNYDKAVLPCYESSEKFCHRHILAEWLNAGIREWSE